MVRLVSVVTSPWTVRLAVAAAVIIALVVPARASANRAAAVEWQPEWRRVSLLEGLSLIPLAGAVATVAFVVKAHEEPQWTGGIFFDSAVRDSFRGRTRAAQKAAGTIGDALYIGGSIAPIVIDLGVALAIHRSPDVALQLLLMDLQSLGVAGLISIGTEHIVGRGRPYALDCNEDGAVIDRNGEPFENRCGSTRSTKSFISGHAAITATVAGLTCIHHQNLPLYGGGLADLAPCVVMIGASLGTGIARMVSDVHWATDVLLGWGVGAVAGYVLPAAIHYGFFGGRERAALTTYPVARMSEDGAEFGVIGSF